MIRCPRTSRHITTHVSTFRRKCEKTQGISRGPCKKDNVSERCLEHIIRRSVICGMCLERCSPRFPSKRTPGGKDWWNLLMRFTLGDWCTASLRSTLLQGKTCGTCPWDLLLVTDVKHGVPDKTGGYFQIAIKTTSKRTPRTQSSWDLLLDGKDTIKGLPNRKKDKSVSRGFASRNTSRETLMKRLEIYSWGRMSDRASYFA